jgi:hypothetical protein
MLFFREGLYECLVAAVTNTHKPGGFKEHILIILQFWKFWKSEVGSQKSGLEG